MGIGEKILKLALPNNRLETAKMSLSLGDGDYFSSSDGSKYERGISGSGSPKIYNDKTIRINARNAYEESPTGRAIVRRHVENTVDCGLKFKSKPLYEIIGISRQAAEKWADDFNLRFDLFMRSKYFSSSGTMNGYQMQRHLMTNEFRDGEYFFVFNYKKINKNQLSPLSFQMIDNNQIGTSGALGLFGNGHSYLNTAGFNDYDFDKGIKRDEYCQELSYLVTYKTIENGNIVYKQKEIPAYLANGMYRMVHGFIPEYPNQLRGNSILKPILQELQQILDCNLGYVMKIIQQSALVVASESEGEESSVDLFEGLNVGQGSMILDQDPSTAISENESLKGSEVLEYKQIPEAQIQTPGSVSFFNLPPGNKVKMLGNPTPSAAYAEFMNNFIAMATPASDMSAEVMQMKFGSNYNANRATLTMAWRIARAYRNELETDALNPMKQAFLETEIALGRMKAPGYHDPYIRAAWLNGEWIGTPMPDMDPVKTMKANKLSVELGATTLDRVAVETNGSDGRINRSENARQINELTRPYWIKEDSTDGSKDSSTSDSSDTV